MRANIHQRYRVRPVRSNRWGPGSAAAFLAADLPQGVKLHEVARPLARHRLSHPLPVLR